MPRDRWRIARRDVSPLQVWATPSATVAAASLLLPILFGQPLSMALALLSVVVGILAIVVQEIRSRIYRPRHIVFLSSSKSNFSRQLLDGLRDGLHDQMLHRLDQAQTVAAERRASADEQVSYLRELWASPPDAIVIRPTTLTAELDDELVRLSMLGCFIVFINTAPSLEKWMKAGHGLPRFVGSDMRLGGVLVGKLLIELFNENHADGVIVLQGPSSKISNATRSAWAARELLTSSLASRCLVHELDEFDEASVLRGCELAMKRLDDALGKTAVRIVVHSGTDRAAGMISNWAVGQRQAHPESARDVILVGYDGLTNPDGTLVAAEVAGAVATVDQCPYLIGREAAAHILAAFHRRTSLRPREVFVTPKIIRIHRNVGAFVSRLQ